MNNKMDYGDRQDRANLLIKLLREKAKAGSDIIYDDKLGNKYTASEVADNIENQTSLGKQLVAVAGFVFHAFYSRK